MHFDRAHDAFRRGSLQTVLELQEPQDGPGGMPVLAERRLRAGDAPGRHLPERMQPVRPTDHDHHPVANRLPRLPALRRRRQALHAEQSSPGLFDAPRDRGITGRFGSSLPITSLFQLSDLAGLRRPMQLRLAHERADELVLPHRMPARDAVLLGHAGQVAGGLFLEVRRGHGSILWLVAGGGRATSRPIPVTGPVTSNQQYPGVAENANQDPPRRVVRAAFSC